MSKQISFDGVFNFWLSGEIDSQKHNNILELAKSKGFNSVAEWRLNQAIRLGLDKKQWQIREISNPEKFLPKILVGPFKGWSVFFENKLSTSFWSLMKNLEFLDWLKTHDRVNPLMRNFPKEAYLILLQKPDGKFICIEGGHRVCAVAYSQFLGKPINFTNRKVYALIAKVNTAEITKLRKFLSEGTDKRN